MEKIKEKHTKIEFLRIVTTNLSRARVCTIHKQELTYIYLEDGYLLCHLCSYHQKIPNDLIILIQEYARCLQSLIDTPVLRSIDFGAAKESICVLLKEIDLFRENYKKHIHAMSERFSSLIAEYQTKALREIDTIINEELVHIKTSERSVSTLEALSKKDVNELQAPEDIIGMYKLSQELSAEKFNSYYVDHKLIENLESFSVKYEAVLSNCLESAYRISTDFLKRKEIFLRISDKPRSFTADKGKIMMDPSEQKENTDKATKKHQGQERVFFYKRSCLEIYQNLENIVDGNCLESIVFEKVFYGTHPCVFKNSLFGCRAADSPEITKLSLDTKRVEVTATIEDAAVDNTLTDWGGVNNMIFCCDKTQLFVVYKSKKNNDLCISQLCDKTLQVLNKYIIKRESSEEKITSIFLINKDFYWFSGFNKSPASLEWKFDPKEGKICKIDIPFANYGGSDFSSHYNLNTQEIWTVNNGKFYAYALEWHE